MIKSSKAVPLTVTHLDWGLSTKSWILFTGKGLLFEVIKAVKPAVYDDVMTSTKSHQEPNKILETSAKKKLIYSMSPLLGSPAFEIRD